MTRAIQPIEAKLLLINEVNARKLLAEYRLILPEAQRVIASAASATPAPIDAANALRQRLYDKRNAIYADLAKIFGTPDRAQQQAPDEPQ
jgi:hypothetical protein